MKSILTAAALAVAASSSVAQTASDYPNKPIKILTTQAPGTASDLLARLHGVSQGGMMPQEAPANAEDWPFYQMQLNRLDQVVRSALVLAVADCVTELHKESPI